MFTSLHIFVIKFVTLKQPTNKEMTKNKVSLTDEIRKYKVVTDAILKETDIPDYLLNSKARNFEIVLARILFAGVLSKTLKVKNADIARALEVDGAAILYYLRQMETELKHNKQFKECWEKVLARVVKPETKKRQPKPTPPENILFLKLCSEIGLTLVTEHRFHPKRKWRFDFALPDLKIAIEKEGGLWVGGRHNRPAGFIKDMEKYNTAAAAGWIVLRAIPKTLATEETLAYLRHAVEQRTKTTTDDKA